MSKDPFVMVPRDAADRMLTAGSNSGRLTMTHLPSEELYVVTRLDSIPAPASRSTSRPSTSTCAGPATDYAGQWFRQPREHINLAHLELIRRPGSAVTFETFKTWVPGVHDPGNRIGLAITIDPELTEEQRRARVREYAGWIVTRDPSTPST